MKPQIITALDHASESALMAFGLRAQMIKACEEMGELTTEICKELNRSPTTKEKIIDEIADVLIMAYQLRCALGEKEVDAQILFKLDRTLNYIRTRNTQGKFVNETDN